jgi:hypothetical protein
LERFRSGIASPDQSAHDAPLPTDLDPPLCELPSTRSQASYHAVVNMRAPGWSYLNEPQSSGRERRPAPCRRRTGRCKGRRCRTAARLRFNAPHISMLSRKKDYLESVSPPPRALLSPRDSRYGSSASPGGCRYFCNQTSKAIAIVDLVNLPTVNMRGLGSAEAFENRACCTTRLTRARGHPNLSKASLGHYTERAARPETSVSLKYKAHATGQSPFQSRFLRISRAMIYDTQCHERLNHR